MDSQSQLKRISQLKSSVNLVLPIATTKEQRPQVTALPERPKPKPKAKTAAAMKRTEVPDFIFNDGLGRFNVDLAEDYTYSDMSGLKVFEKLWKGLLQWWTWNIKLVRPLTKEEKGEVQKCLAGLSEEILEYQSIAKRGQPSRRRNDLYNRVAMVLNWAENSTRRKLPFSGLSATQ